MKRINEIFHSLQGEGRHTGTPAVFVRFSGCNLHCPFCDTDHAVGREMSDEEIIAEVRRHDVPLVVLTGGEPSLQLDAPFLKKLKEATGATIAIETNGTHPLPPGIDWVTLSPKTGIADRDLPIVLEHADEIKVVDTGQDLAPYLALPACHADTYLYLQPCHVTDEAQSRANTAATVRRVLANPLWRLSLQTHRLLDIP